MEKQYENAEIALLRETGLSIEDIAEWGKRDLFFAATGLYGFDRLAKPTHKEACDFIGDENIRLAGEIYPRGCGKTTVLKSSILQWIAKKPDVRILYVCKTIGVASGTARDLESRIMGKGKSLYPIFYPHILPKNRRETVWNSINFTVNRRQSWDECTFECAGLGTNKTKMHYDIIYLDDPTAPDIDDYGVDHIRVDTDVMDQLIGFMELLDGLLDPGGLRLVRFAGTRWGVNDAIAWLKENRPGFRWFEKPLVDEEGHSNFPTFYSDAECVELKKKGSFFYQTQYMNVPRSIDSAEFKLEDIQSYRKAPKYGDMFITVTIDPSMGKKTSTSNTAIVCCGTTRDGQTYVLDYLNDKINPADTVTQAMNLARKYDPDVIGFEAVGFQEVLEPHIRTAMREEQKRWRVEAIKRDRQSKDDRILVIQPFVENHDLFLRPNMKDLRQQLLDFPFGMKDLLDCVADHFKLLNKYTGRISYKSREIDGKASDEVTRVALPQDTPERLFVYGEVDKDLGTTQGFVVLLGVVSQKEIYVLDASALGEDCVDPYVVASDYGFDRVVTTVELRDQFFRGTDISAKGIKGMEPTGELAIAKITRGEVKFLSEGNGKILTSFSSDMGMKALEFALRAMRRGGKLKVKVLGHQAREQELVGARENRE